MDHRKSCRLEGRNSGIMNLRIFLILCCSAVLFFCCSKKRGEKKVKVKIEVFNTGRNYVRALALEDDFLWVGTSDGVLKVAVKSGNLLNTYTTKDGLKNNYVFTIGVDRQKVKWFGTNAGGLTRFDGTNWRTYLPLHGLADFWVYSLDFAPEGLIWIGTWAGANKFDGKKFVTYTPDNGLINEWVYGVGVDREKGVWFGTEGGVSFFDGEKWKSWTNKDGLGAANTKNLKKSSNSGLGTIDRHNLNILDPQGKETYNPNYVFCVLVDAKNNKWFGTWGGGVSRFDGREWKNFSVRDGLAGNIVYSLAVDKKGIFWFGTNGGVSRFDGKRFQNFGRIDGLPDQHVYSIAVDAYNNKWLGQRGGVVKLTELTPSPEKNSGRRTVPGVKK